MAASLRPDTLAECPGALAPGAALALHGVPVLSLAAHSHVLVVGATMLLDAVAPRGSGGAAAG